MDFTPIELRVDVTEDTTGRPDSAVRVTHLFSGIAMTVEDQPAQKANYDRALILLREAPGTEDQ